MLRNQALLVHTQAQP